MAGRGLLRLGTAGLGKARRVRGSVFLAICLAAALGQPRAAYYPLTRIAVSATIPLPAGGAWKRIGGRSPGRAGRLD